MSDAVVSVWNGTEEVEAVATLWDGTEEVAVTIEITP